MAWELGDFESHEGKRQYIDGSIKLEVMGRRLPVIDDVYPGEEDSAGHEIFQRRWLARHIGAQLPLGGIFRASDQSLGRDIKTPSVQDEQASKDRQEPIGDVLGEVLPKSIIPVVFVVSFVGVFFSNRGGLVAAWGLIWLGLIVWWGLIWPTETKQANVVTTSDIEMAISITDHHFSRVFSLSIHLPQSRKCPDCCGYYT